MNLFLPSTNLNFLLSYAVASFEKAAHNSDNQLLFIDQKKQNKIAEYLPDAKIFSSIDFLLAQEKNLSKLQTRKNNFLFLDKYLANLKLQNAEFLNVFVGSDRRIEFQYLMHKAAKMGIKTCGNYLDDGLYSYYNHARGKIENLINSGLKKLTYGFWWDEPQLISASKWIKNLWLLQPELAYAGIKQNKKVFDIKQYNFLEAIKVFSASYIKSQKQAGLIREQITQADVCFIISHPADFKKNFIKNLVLMLEKNLKENKKVVLKNHPALQDNHALSCELDKLANNFKDNLTILNQDLILELIIPLFSSKTNVYLDYSTGTFSFIWFGDNLDLTAFINNLHPKNPVYVDLLKAYKIPIITI